MQIASGSYFFSPPLPPFRGGVGVGWHRGRGRGARFFLGREMRPRRTVGYEARWRAELNAIAADRRSRNRARQQTRVGARGRAGAAAECERDSATI